MPTIQEYQEYERAVRTLLEEKIRRECPGAQLGFFHNRKFRGKSRHEHQIDVSAEIVLAGIRLVLIVECKRYRDTVSIEDVLTLSGRLEDIGSAHKGIVVTTVGFQPGAKKISEAKGIALILESPGKTSWEVVMPAFIFPAFIVGAAEILARTPSKSVPVAERDSDLFREALKTSNSPVRSTSEDTPIASKRTQTRLAAFNLGATAAPNDKILAAAGSVLAASYPIWEWPVVSMRAFGSVWPFNDFDHPSPLGYGRFLGREKQSRSEVANSLAALVPNGVTADLIRSFLLDKAEKTAMSCFADGLAFSVEVTPEDVGIAAGSGPLSNLYLIHVAFWMALYGDPNGMGDRIRNHILEEVNELSPAAHYKALLDFLAIDALRGWRDWIWNAYSWPPSATNYVSLMVAIDGQTGVFVDIIFDGFVECLRDHIKWCRLSQKREPAARRVSHLVNNVLALATHFKAAKLVDEISVLIEKEAFAEMKPFVRFII